MAKTKQQKQDQLSQLIDGIRQSKSVVFANFQGLKVKDMDELRGRCRVEGISCVATKKTLVRRALAENGLEVDTKAFAGSIVAFFARDEEVLPAQIVAKFAKDHEIMKIFGGVLEGSFIDVVKVTELSALPGKMELLARLVGSLNAPVSGLVHVLAGNLRGLVTVLQAVKEQKAA